MTARNRAKFETGQAHRAEILSILESYDWRAPLAKIPAVKVIRDQMSCRPALALRSVQWHVAELYRLERQRLRTRNLSSELIGV